ncbi:unnamed protein product [Lymnaea stagnalis]|uniref:Amino acid transporter transmembrane domain-containing protein n=1 Tax=Lymnaea stagnalis TaxID=6523 RepID=A0AAV2HB12_LYMST
MAGILGSSSGNGTTNPIKIFANIFIAFIGAGILGLPYAFKEAGILEGCFIMILVGVFSVKTMLLLVECKYRIIDRTTSGENFDDPREDGLYAHLMGSHEEKKDSLKEEGDLMTRIKDQKPFVAEDLTYGDVGNEAMGPAGRILVDFAVVLSQMGFSCAYLIFICRNLSNFVPKIEMAYWLLILLPPLSLLTLCRNLSSLAVTSFIAQCSNLFAFGIVFWFDFKHASSVKMHPREISMENLPFFAVIAIYCYEGAGLILPLEASLAKEVRPKFKKFFISTMVGITTLYITFGICGYLSFGPETNQIITLNLPNGDGFNLAVLVKSCMCLALFLSYPVMMFPVMKTLEHYFILDPDRSICKVNVMRGLVVLLTGGVVIMIPNFADLMALVGASFCTLLIFILPALFHLRLFKGKLNKRQIALNWLLVVIGIMGIICGLWDAIRRLSGDDGVTEVATAQTTIIPTALVPTAEVVTPTGRVVTPNGQAVTPTGHVDITNTTLDILAAVTKAMTSAANVVTTNNTTSLGLNHSSSTSSVFNTFNVTVVPKKG